MPVKLHLSWMVSAMVIVAGIAPGQGTFFYDQQSSDESYFGSGAAGIQSNQPFGQSFTPGTPSLNFVRLFLSDAVPDSLGATIRVNLRSGGITGTVLSSTDPVTVTEAFNGIVNFFFPANVPLTPGTQYYFQPEVMTGGPFSVASYNNFQYAGGNAYYSGVMSPGFDLWFREAVYNIPEPSAATLGIFCAAWLACTRRSRFLAHEALP